MWAYDDGRSRRTRDIPSSRPANYYDDAYERAPPRSSRHAYPEPQPQPQPKHSSHDRHRRKSAMVDPDGPRPRRNTHAGGVSVVASDDGTGYPYGGDATRDAAYGSSYPTTGKKSRHDAEHKTGDRDRRFREKRGTWEADEAENLRRAKSYSPRRAAREAEAAPRRVSPQAPKSAWPEDDYATAPAGAGGSHHHHRPSKKGGGKAPQQQQQQYYDDDPYASYYASQAPRSSSKKQADRGVPPSAYDYAPSADDMPRPPMGEHAPYKSSPLGGGGSSYPEATEKPSKHHRKQREKDYYGTGGYDDYTTAAAPKAGTSYDRAGYGAAAAAAEEMPAGPRRSRHSKQHHDDRGAAAAGMDEYGYPPQAPRGRHRGAGGGGGDYGDADPYDPRGAPPPSRPRHRQSMPPQPRSAYAGDSDAYDTDPYGQAAPRRRATSVNYGRQRDRYGGGGDPYYEDGYGGGARGGASPSGSGGSGGAAGAGGRKGNKKSKAYAQQAGKLFMTHAVPVIKKEAVPFLTKAAQAYFEHQKR